MPAPALTNMATIRPGDVLGPYRVGDLLGEGGMARVYAAEHSRIGLSAAVKVLDLDPGSPESRLRFQREARLLSQVRHENVVSVLDFGTTPTGLPYLVTEYLPGETLDERLARRAPMGWPEAAELIRQLLCALRAVHWEGIVHRDVKPENCVLVPGPEGVRLKLIDFGVAKSVVVGDPSLTQPHVTVGTPWYMAPEQARGRPLDARTDLYSVGAIAFEMLSGRPPFEGECAPEIVAQHLRDAVPSVLARHPDTDAPSAIDRFIRRAMAKDPADRFLDADAMLRALSKLTEEVRNPASEISDAPRPVPAAPPGVPQSIAPALSLGISLVPAEAELAAAESSVLRAARDGSRKGVMLAVSTAIAAAAIGFGSPALLGIGDALAANVAALGQMVSDPSTLAGTAFAPNERPARHVGPNTNPPTEPPPRPQPLPPPIASSGAVSAWSPPLATSSARATKVIARPPPLSLGFIEGSRARDHARKSRAKRKGPDADPLASAPEKSPSDPPADPPAAAPKPTAEPAPPKPAAVDDRSAEPGTGTEPVEKDQDASVDVSAGAAERTLDEETE